MTIVNKALFNMSVAAAAQTEEKAGTGYKFFPHTVIEDYQVGEWRLEACEYDQQYRDKRCFVVLWLKLEGEDVNNQQYRIARFHDREETLACFEQAKGDIAYQILTGKPVVAKEILKGLSAW